MPETPADIIDVLGGPSIVAERLQKPLTTVSSWKMRGSIPTEAWPPIIEFARERRVKGVTFRSLTLMHSGPTQATESAR